MSWWVNEDNQIFLLHNPGKGYCLWNSKSKSIPQIWFQTRRNCKLCSLKLSVRIDWSKFLTLKENLHDHWSLSWLFRRISQPFLLSLKENFGSQVHFWWKISYASLDKWTLALMKLWIPLQRLTSIPQMSLE